MTIAPLSSHAPRVARDEIPWRRAVWRACGEPDAVRVAFQPIVDLRDGVVRGYEALARFAIEPVAPPDRWFSAAALHGLEAPLEARVLGDALGARRHLPANCFLSLNLSPRAALSFEVHETFRAAGRLEGVIVEITEHVGVDDFALVRALEPLREAGALVAVDDAGSGYASLCQITALRPDFIKIDQSLVSGLDSDPAKVAVVETLGALARRIDAWVVAEGIERAKEIEALICLGIPLGQGFIFGRPAAGMAAIDGDLAHWVRERAVATERGGTVAPLLEDAMTAPADARREEIVERVLGDPRCAQVVLVDDDGRPVGVHERTAFTRGDAPAAPLRVESSTSPAAAARRAMVRPAQDRFTPLVCCDPDGRLLGVLRVERLVEALTE